MTRAAACRSDVSREVPVPFVHLFMPSIADSGVRLQFVLSGGKVTYGRTWVC